MLSKKTVLVVPCTNFACYVHFAAQQRWADCNILRSRSSPEFSKLSPSPTAVQTFFEIKSPSPNKVQKINKIQLFNSKYHAILLH